MPYRTVDTLIKSQYVTFSPQLVLGVQPVPQPVHALHVPGTQPHRKADGEAEQKAQVAPQVIWLSILNATLCTAVPVLLVMMAVERIGPTLAAQVGMIGPLSTIAMGIVLLGEPFTPWLAAGTALVVAGIFLFGRAGR